MTKYLSFLVGISVLNVSESFRCRMQDKFSEIAQGSEPPQNQNGKIFKEFIGRIVSKDTNLLHQGTGRP